MTTGIMNHSTGQPPSGNPLVIEYTLTLSDYHALDMFLYDNVLRKRARFRFEFYGTWLLQAAALGAVMGLMVWGILKAEGTVPSEVAPFLPSEPAMSRHPFSSCFYWPGWSLAAFFTVWFARRTRSDFGRLAVLSCRRA